MLSLKLLFERQCQLIPGQLTMRCDSHDVVFVTQTLKSNTRLKEHTMKIDQTDWVCLFFSSQS